MSFFGALKIMQRDLKPMRMKNAEHSHKLDKHATPWLYMSKSHGISTIMPQSANLYFAWTFLFCFCNFARTPGIRRIQDAAAHSLRSKSDGVLCRRGSNLYRNRTANSRDFNNYFGNSYLNEQLH